MYCPHAQNLNEAKPQPPTQGKARDPLELVQVSELLKLLPEFLLRCSVGAAPKVNEPHLQWRWDMGQQLGSTYHFEVTKKCIDTG